MNAGIAPGVTNLLAAELLEENPDADEVELVFTVTTHGTGGAAAAPFAHRGFTGRGHHRVMQVTLPEHVRLPSGAGLRRAGRRLARADG